VPRAVSRAGTPGAHGQITAGVRTGASEGWIRVDVHRALARLAGEVQLAVMESPPEPPLEPAWRLRGHGREESVRSASDAPPGRLSAGDDAPGGQA
jgi:hypothetical protein